MSTNESWASERAKEALQKVMEDSAVWRMYANTSRFQEAVDIVANAILEARGGDAQGFEEWWLNNPKNELVRDRKSSWINESAYQNDLEVWNAAFAAGAQSCQCEELKQMLKDAKAGLEKTMQLLNEPTAQGFEEWWCKQNPAFKINWKHPNVESQLKAWQAAYEAGAQSVRPDNKNFSDYMQSPLRLKDMARSLVYYFKHEKFEEVDAIEKITAALIDAQSRSPRLPESERIAEIYYEEATNKDSTFWSRFRERLNAPARTDAGSDEGKL